MADMPFEALGTFGVGGSFRGLWGWCPCAIPGGLDLGGEAPAQGGGISALPLGGGHGAAAQGPGEPAATRALGGLDISR